MHAHANQSGSTTLSPSQADGSQNEPTAVLTKSELFGRAIRREILDRQHPASWGNMTEIAIAIAVQGGAVYLVFRKSAEGTILGLSCSLFYNFILNAFFMLDSNRSLKPLGRIIFPDENLEKLDPKTYTARNWCKTFLINVESFGLAIPSAMFYSDLAISYPVIEMSAPIIIFIIAAFAFLNQPGSKKLVNAIHGELQKILDDFLSVFNLLFNKASYDERTLRHAKIKCAEEIREFFASSKDKLSRHISSALRMSGVNEALKTKLQTLQELMQQHYKKALSDAETNVFSNWVFLIYKEINSIKETPPTSLRRGVRSFVSATLNEILFFAVNLSFYGVFCQLAQTVDTNPTSSKDFNVVSLIPNVDVNLALGLVMTLGTTELIMQSLFDGNQPYLWRNRFSKTMFLLTALYGLAYYSVSAAVRPMEDMMTDYSNFMYSMVVYMGGYFGAGFFNAFAVAPIISQTTAAIARYRSIKGAKEPHHVDAHVNYLLDGVTDLVNRFDSDPDALLKLCVDPRLAQALPEELLSKTQLLLGISARDFSASNISPAKQILLTLNDYFLSVSVLTTFLTREWLLKTPKLGGRDPLEYWQILYDVALTFGVNLVLAYLNKLIYSMAFKEPKAAADVEHALIPHTPVANNRNGFFKQLWKPAVNTLHDFTRIFSFVLLIQWTWDFLRHSSKDPSKDPFGESYDVVPELLKASLIFLVVLNTFRNHRTKAMTEFAATEDSNSSAPEYGALQINHVAGGGRKSPGLGSR